MPFRIYTIELDPGTVGICPLPGRFSPLLQDLELVSSWNPAIVISMTETPEMISKGAESLGSMLQQYGIDWAQLPIPDYGTPETETASLWPSLSAQLLEMLDVDRRVLLHCFGGRGRSGMIALRLMVERGENAESALARLRSIRPGAVETDAQLAWATSPKAV